MGKCCLHASSFIFDRIIIEVAANQDRHRRSDEFDFDPDQTTHFGVTCHWMTKIYTSELENLWGQLANLDQILCVASLGVGKGCIMFWGRLDQNPGVHGNRNSHWRIMGKMVSPSFLGCFWSDPFILAGDENRHKISDEIEFWPDRTTHYGVSCHWTSKKIPIDL